MRWAQIYFFYLAALIAYNLFYALAGQGSGRRRSWLITGRPRYDWSYFQAPTWQAFLIGSVGPLLLGAAAAAAYWPVLQHEGRPFSQAPSALACCLLVEVWLLWHRARVWRGYEPARLRTLTLSPVGGALSLLVFAGRTSS